MENSEMTAEAVRLINSELISQKYSKSDKIKMVLFSQMLRAIDSATAENVLPQLQNSLRELEWIKSPLHYTGFPKLVQAANHGPINPNEF